MGMEVQLSMIGRIQGNVLNKKLELLAGMQDRRCPIAGCAGNLVKCGKNKSPFHDVFTDHMVLMQRFKCNIFGHKSRSTSKLIMEAIQSAETQIIQSKFGETHTYLEFEEIFSIFNRAESASNVADSQAIFGMAIKSLDISSNIILALLED